MDISVGEGFREISVGEGFRLRFPRPRRQGVKGFWEGRKFLISKGEDVVYEFYEAPGRLLDKLIRMQAATPKELSKELGITAAGILYNMQPLLQSGIVQKKEFPGGSAYYYVCWEIELELSPILKKKLIKVEEKYGGLNAVTQLSLAKLERELDVTSDGFQKIMLYLRDHMRNKEG